MPLHWATMVTYKGMSHIRLGLSKYAKEQSIVAKREHVAAAIV